MALPDYTVLTPERVSLEYGIAGIGSRGGAAMVDTLIQLAALVVLSVALFASALASTLFGDAAGTEPGGSILVGLFFLGLFLIINGYFMLFEILWSGQTPGKRLLGLRVIRESGYPIRPVDAVIRNLVRIVDWLPLFYGIGVLVMLLNKRAKRLGDFASGTIVVREGATRTLSIATAPQPAAAETDFEPAVSVAYRLASADATLVRDFLVRRASMDPAARARLAHRLAGALSSRYHLPLDTASDPERFLERLA